jgi:hypothetical protein
VTHDSAPSYVQAAVADLQPKVPARDGFKAALDEGLPSLTLPNLLYMENPYSHKKCQ